MVIIDKESREFIAKNFADMGKAILTIGFASYFFEKLPIMLRVGFVVMGVVFFMWSIIIYSWKERNQ